MVGPGRAITPEEIASLRLALNSSRKSHRMLVMSAERLQHIANAYDLQYDRNTAAENNQPLGGDLLRPDRAAQRQGLWASPVYRHPATRAAASHPEERGRLVEQKGRRASSAFGSLRPFFLSRKNCRCERVISIAASGR